MKQNRICAESLVDKKKQKYETLIEEMLFLATATVISMKWNENARYEHERTNFDQISWITKPEWLAASRADAMEI